MSEPDGMSDGLLQVRGLTKRFAGIVALDDVSIDLDDGERVGLIGPNGAGKTTLLQLHARRAARPTAARVELDGPDITGLPVHASGPAWASGARSSASSCSPTATVRDHLFIAERVRRGGGAPLEGPPRPRPPRRRGDRRAATRCSSCSGLGDLADEPIERLSLGQCRLVEVGRALMTEPKVLLLDEPSSGSTVRSRRRWPRPSQEVQAEQGFAILLVEHDVELVVDVHHPVLRARLRPVIARRPDP